MINGRLAEFLDLLEPAMDMNWIDTNNDGYNDFGYGDANGDGNYETVEADLNHDGTLDTYAYDTDHDGYLDTYVVDSNFDGYLDTTAHDDGHAAQTSEWTSEMTGGGPDAGNPDLNQVTMSNAYIQGTGSVYYYYGTAY